MHEGRRLIAHQMLRDTQHPIGHRPGGRIIQAFGDGLCLLSGDQRPAEVSEPGQIEVEPSQYLKLARKIVQCLGEMQGSEKSCPDCLGIAAAKHQCLTQCGLELHLPAIVRRPAGGKSGERLPGTVVTLLQQRQVHPQRHRRSGQSHADRRVPGCGESPIERRAQVVDIARVIGSPVRR